MKPSCCSMLPGLLFIIFISTFPASGSMPDEAIASAMADESLCAALDKAKSRIIELEETIARQEEEVSQADERLKNALATQQANAANSSQELTDAGEALAKKEIELRASRAELVDEQRKLTAVDVEALKREREIKKRQYEEAVAIQETTRNADKVRDMEERVDKLQAEIEAEIGLVDPANIAQLRTNLEEINKRVQARDLFSPVEIKRPAHGGNPLLRAKLRQLEDFQESRSTSLEERDVIMGFRKRAETLIIEIDTLIKGAVVKLIRLEQLITSELPALRKEAENNLNSDEKEKLKNLDRFKGEYNAAATAVLRAEEELETNKRIRANIQRLKETIAEYEKQRNEAAQKLEQAKSRAASVAPEVQAAQNDLRGAQNELNKAQKELQQTELKVKTQETRLRQLQSEVKKYADTIVALGRKASLSSSSKEECLQNVDAAREPARKLIALVQANRACLDEWQIEGARTVLANMKQIREACEGRGRHSPEPNSRSDSGFKSTGWSTDKLVKPANGRSSLSPSDPNNPHVVQALGAKERCDFDRALASLNLYNPGDPNDAWLAATYKEIHNAREKRDAALRLLREAAGILNQADLTPREAMRAVDLVKVARRLAPSCISDKISTLTPALNDAVAVAVEREEARQQARREQQRIATNEAIGTLLTGIMGVIATAREGGDSTVPTSSLPSGGGTQPGNQSFCVRQIVGTGGWANYIFAKTVNQNGGATTVYTLYSDSPTDGEGKPVRAVPPATLSSLTQYWGRAIWQGNSHAAARDELFRIARQCRDMTTLPRR